MRTLGQATPRVTPSSQRRKAHSPMKRTLRIWPSGQHRSRRPRRRRRRQLRRTRQGRVTPVVHGREQRSASCELWGARESAAQKTLSMIQTERGRQVSTGPNSFPRKGSKPWWPTSGETNELPPLALVWKDQRRGQPQLHRRSTRPVLTLMLSLGLLLSGFDSRRPSKGGPYRDKES